MSRAGACCRTASGAPVPKLGELDVQFITNEGYVGAILFQLADIARPLIAVSALAKAGNVVELYENGGRIVHHSGKTTNLERRGGTHALRMWIADEGAAAPFHRQGAR